MLPFARLFTLLLLLVGVGKGTALLAADADLGNLHAELNPPRVPGVEVRDLRTTGATLEWPASLSPMERFQVQIRRFTPDAEQGLAMHWESFGTVKVKREGALWHAHLSSLQPAQPYWFRVLPQVAPGAPVEALFAVRFQTPPKKAVFTGRRVLLGGLGAVLVVLAWMRWQGQRGAR